MEAGCASSHFTAGTSDLGLSGWYLLVLALLVPPAFIELKVLYFWKNQLYYLLKVFLQKKDFVAFGPNGE